MYAVANSNTSILRIKYEEPVMPYISPRNDCAEISTYMALRYHDIISNYQNIVNTEQSIIDSQDVKGPNPSKCTCNK